MKNNIYVTGIKLHAFHGCLEEEARVGANYTVNVKLSTNFMEAAENDDLKKTVDYCDVYEIVKEEMGKRSKLIEQVCERIFTRLKKEVKGIDSLEIKIVKHRPPINGNVDEVAVEMAD